EVHDPASTAIQVDLERVASRVLIDARLVALVRGGVVEPRLGELEHRGGREGSATLQQIEEGKEAHGGWIVPFFTSLDKSALRLDKSAFGGHFTFTSHRLEGSRYATGPSCDPRARRWPVVGGPTSRAGLHRCRHGQGRGWHNATASRQCWRLDRRNAVPHAHAAGRRLPAERGAR